MEENKVVEPVVDEPIMDVKNMYSDGIEMNEPPIQEYIVRKGYLKVKCGCGNDTKITDEIIQEGLSWSMIVGNEHYLKLHCDKCDSDLTMYIEEIIDNNELPEESNQE